MKRCSLVVCLGFLTVASGQAREFFASAGGSAEGDGSRDRPWSLAFALSQTGAVRPGDTLWLQPGTYAGGFVCELSGTDSAPITLRGEGRATLDLTPRYAKDRGLFDVKGDWLVIRDLEFTSSDPQRTSAQAGSWPTDMRRGSISARGSNLRFINLAVHDLAQGFGLWGNESSGEGGEIYGCVIYNNGWSGPDRGHGHGIYAQNARGTKRICDNIIFNQFGYGLHAYGSEKAFLRGFHIDGNVMFNNGSLKGAGHRASDLAVGGSCPMDEIVIQDNCTYGGGGLRIGYSLSALNRGMTLTGNIIAGASRFTAVNQVRFRGNSLIAPGTLLSWDEPAVAQSKREIDWDGNSYTRTKMEFGAFNVAAEGKTQAKGFTDWQTFLTSDATSSYTEGPAKGQKIIVRPNRYEPGRGHIIVYNWDKAPTVAVNLGKVLKPGQRYRVVNAQNPFGSPIVAGTFAGKSIELPMAASPAVAPVGMSDYALPVTEPEFGVFVVLPEGE